MSNRRTMVVGIILLAVLALVPAALAQNPVTYSSTVQVTNQVTTNSCSAAELVTLNGTVTAKYSVSTDSSGVNQFAVTASNNLNGAGQTSNGQYAAADSADYTISSSGSADATVQLKADLTSSSAGTTNMTLVQTLHLTMDLIGNIVIQVQANETQCGN